MVMAKHSSAFNTNYTTAKASNMVDRLIWTDMHALTIFTADQHLSVFLRHMPGAINGTNT